MKVVVDDEVLECIEHDCKNQTMKIHYCSIDFARINRLFAKSEPVLLSYKNVEKSIVFTSVEVKECGAIYGYKVLEPVVLDEGILRKIRKSY